MKPGQLTRLCLTACVVLRLQTPALSQAQGIPAKVATCAITRIAALEHRLQAGAGGPFVKDSGSAVRYSNGTYQVSYDELPAVDRSRVGDRVILCLISIPRDCPPGDVRGRLYTATNLRTVESWTMPDAAHGCGGA